MRFATVLLVILLCSCTKRAERERESGFGPIDTMAHQIGDAMVAIDEAGGDDGGYSISSAIATTCRLANTWGSCTSGQIVRDFQGCTRGGATFTGQTTFTFSDASCAVDSDGDSVSRSPSFTITGRGGGNFTVSRTGTFGQRVTRVSSSSFTFASDGIRRVLKHGGTTLSDFTTSTTSPLSITGATRNGRIVSGGALGVFNNLAGVGCQFAPSNVQWNATCSCAVSGIWTASCSNSVVSIFQIEGCGTGTLTYGSSSIPVTLDQCESL